MNVGSRPFCVINMDGSWPEMVAGCDIRAYQACLVQFKDAWKTVHKARGGKGNARYRSEDAAIAGVPKASYPRT